MDIIKILKIYKMHIVQDKNTYIVEQELLNFSYKC